MTVDEFRPGAEAQGLGRYELEDGQIVTLQSERIEHREVKFDRSARSH